MRHACTTPPASISTRCQPHAFVPMLRRVHGVALAVDDVAMERVLDVAAARLRAGPEDARAVRLVVGEEQLACRAGTPARAARGARRGAGRPAGRVLGVVGEQRRMCRRSRSRGSTAADRGSPLQLQVLRNQSCGRTCSGARSGPRLYAVMRKTSVVGVVLRDLDDDVEVAARRRRCRCRSARTPDRCPPRRRFSSIS